MPPPTPAFEDVEPRSTSTPLHAIVLYVTNIDHEELAYNYRGRAFVLTGVRRRGEV